MRKSAIHVDWGCLALKRPSMNKTYVAISAMIFGLVAVGHIARLAQGILWWSGYLESQALHTDTFSRRLLPSGISYILEVIFISSSLRARPEPAMIAATCGASVLNSR
jgi:hypothetical protein